MAATITQAIKVLEAKANDDPSLAEALLFLVDDLEGPRDPFADPGSGVLAAARSVNERRLERQRQARVDTALDTAEIVALIHSIRDRKGVDRRRHRGKLLGWQAGGRTLHPAWQFDRRLGDTRPGLDRVLAALAEVAPDPQAADTLMSTRRDDLDGRSLAELFGEGRVDTVVRLVLAAGDQS